jgi:parallel beta-helix repeat protein
MLSRNMTNSIVRSNNVSNEDRGAVISESSNNQIYNNTISESGRGVDLDKESFENIIHDNTILDIEDPENALSIEDDAGDQNDLYSNVLLDSN